MVLLEEIREHFASMIGGFRPIDNLPDEYPAWTIITEDGYGVAILNKFNKIINENFSNAVIFSATLEVDGVARSYLILKSDLTSLKYEFASVCEQFVDPGDQGEKRYELEINPHYWWENWKNLLGNSISDRNAYSVIGELLALENLLREGENVKWTGVNQGSHDIESDTGSYEVKSTIKKYETSVTISSQYQLKSDKRLLLYFCRLEESRLGISVNDMIEKLVNLGYNKNLLEVQLTHLGFKNGSTIRDQKYKILEKRKYIVDGKFPQITNKSFVDGKIPDSIKKIQYTIDLDGLQYDKW